MPPDYVSLLQHVLEPPVPSPTAADHVRFQSYTAKRGMSRDKTASAACTCLLAGALLYNVQILWRCFQLDEPVVAGKPVNSLIASATAAVCWVLAHVLMELAFMCWVSREPALYKRHRSCCMMVTRTGLLLLMSFYIPKTYDHTLAMEVQAGRAAAATLRLVTGFVAIHVLEVLCFRLPTRLAVPYHTARVAFALATLPSTMRVFAAHPAVTAVACNIWGQIGFVYLSAASNILGTPLTSYDAVHPDGTAAVVLGATANSTTVQSVGQAVLVQSLSTTHNLCVVVLLLVFLNVTLGLAVPLYVLYVLEVSDFRAFMAAGDRAGSTGSNSSNGSVSSAASSSRSLGSTLAPGSSSITSSILEQQHHHHHPQQQQAHHTQATGSTVRSADAGNAASAAVVSLGAAGVLHEPGEGHIGSGSALRGGSLLRAAVAARGNPAVLAPAGPAATSGADPASAVAAAAAATAAPASAVSVGSGGDGPSTRGLSGVWPVHFSVPLHALVLFCMTGWVWAGFSAGWGIWQQRLGADTCFVPVPT